MLDYRSLPFISLKPVRGIARTPRPQPPPESAVAHDLEFAVYGWSRAPIYAPGHQRVAAAATRCSTGWWHRASRCGRPSTRDDERFRVYFFNDSFGIYALGYPAISALGHLINLGELVFLAGVLYLILLAARRLYRALTAQTPRSGRALLREARSRFYRKLFVGFVASAVVPVVVLAFATRTYSRQSVPCRRRGLRGQDRHRGAAAGRRLCRPAAARRELAAGSRRSVHGAGALGHRSGREPVRSLAAAGDQRTRPVRVAPVAVAYAEQRLPAHRARSAADDRQRRGRRRPAVSAGGGAGPHRRSARDCHGAAAAARAGNRAAARRTRPAGAVGVGAVRAARRGVWLLDRGADCRSGEPADTRHQAHRARRSRRPDRRRARRTNCEAWSRTSIRWPTTSSASGPTSNARSDSRRGRTWPARWRTTSRIR